jgi:hypothetical protein
MRLLRQGQACIDRTIVEENRTGSAVPLSAALFHVRVSQPFPQDPKQCFFGRDLRFFHDAVDIKFQWIRF